MVFLSSGSYSGPVGLCTQHYLHKHKGRDVYGAGKLSLLQNAMKTYKILNLVKIWTVNTTATICYLVKPKNLRPEICPQKQYHMGQLNEIQFSFFNISTD